MKVAVVRFGFGRRGLEPPSAIVRAILASGMQPIQQMPSEFTSLKVKVQSDITRHPEEQEQSRQSRGGVALAFSIA
eukprot:s462_g16.t1